MLVIAAGGGDVRCILCRHVGTDEVEYLLSARPIGHAVDELPDVGIPWIDRVVDPEPLDQIECRVLQVDSGDGRRTHRVGALDPDVAEATDADDAGVVAGIQLPDRLLRGVIGGDSASACGAMLTGSWPISDRLRASTRRAAP